MFCSCFSELGLSRPITPLSEGRCQPNLLPMLGACQNRHTNANAGTKCKFSNKSDSKGNPMYSGLTSLKLETCPRVFRPDVGHVLVPCFGDTPTLRMFAMSERTPQITFSFCIVQRTREMFYRKRDVVANCECLRANASLDTKRPTHDNPPKERKQGPLKKSAPFQPF